MSNLPAMGSMAPDQSLFESACQTAILALYLTLLAGAWLLLKRQYTHAQVLLRVAIVILNSRYLLFGMSAGSAFLTNLGDWFVNLTRPSLDCEQVTAFRQVDGNELSHVSQYVCHPAWSVAFWYHFGVGRLDQKLMLHVHIILMTLSLATSVLHVSVLRPGKWHRRAGRVSALAGVPGVILGVTVGLEDANSPDYGGMWAVYGWIWMATSSLTPLLLGVRAVLRNDIKAHKRWMTRFYCAMWSDFLIFRVMLILGTPLFDDCRQCMILSCIWVSPAIGMILSEVVLNWREFSTELPFGWRSRKTAKL